MMALHYYALGDGAEQHLERTIRHYYGFAGRYADSLVRASVADEGRLREDLERYRSLGCDEVILFPCNPDPGQVDALAGVAL